MKTMRGAFLLAAVLFMLPVAGYGQEQSSNKANQDSGAEAKKETSSVPGLIKNVFQEQKDKYQKEIQDQIQNKLKYVDDKFKAVKSLAGKVEPENLPKKEITPQSGKTARETADQKLAQKADRPADSGLDLRGKLDALYAATMAFLKQLMAILFK
jgi:hypothetical protein